MPILLGKVNQRARRRSENWRVLCLGYAGAKLAVDGPVDGLARIAGAWV